MSYIKVLTINYFCHKYDPCVTNMGSSDVKVAHQMLENSHVPDFRLCCTCPTSDIISIVKTQN